MPSAIVRDFIGTAGDTTTFRSKLREQNQTLGYSHRGTMGRCSSVPTAYVVAMVMLMASFALALAGVASPLWWESWPTPRVRLRWGLWQCAPSDAKTKCDSFTGGNGGVWRVIQCLQVAAVVLLFSADVSAVLAVGVWMRTRHDGARTSTAVASITGGVVGMAGNSAYVGFAELYIRHVDNSFPYGWSFALTWLGYILSVFAALLLIVSKYCEPTCITWPETPPPRPYLSPVMSHLPVKTNPRSCHQQHGCITKKAETSPATVVLPSVHSPHPPPQHIACEPIHYLGCNLQYPRVHDPRQLSFLAQEAQDRQQRLAKDVQQPLPRQQTRTMPTIFAANGNQQNEGVRVPGQRENNSQGLSPNDSNQHAALQTSVSGPYVRFREDTMDERVAGPCAMENDQSRLLQSRLSSGRRLSRSVTPRENRRLYRTATRTANRHLVL